MKSKVIPGLILLAAASLVLSALSETGPSRAVRDIDAFMEKMRAAPRSAVIFLKQRSFSEELFNLYLNQIYIKKEIPEVKQISMKFLENGYLQVDLRMELEPAKFSKVPAAFLKPRIEMKTTVESSNGKMRLKPSSIHLNGVPFSPELLNELLALAQSGRATKRSLYDWFELFPGIRKIEVEKARIIFFY
jgi:hypothetical protein